MFYNISDLLPYMDDTLLTSLKERIRILQLLEFLYKSAGNAIQAFLIKDYSSFDAQVSENLCQIRAYQLVQIINNLDNECVKEVDVFCQKIKNVYMECDSLLREYITLSKKKPSHYTKLINQKITISHMLQKHELNVELSDLTYLLIQKYILSQYKLVGEHNISNGIDYDKICLDLSIASKTFARKVVHRLQRNVSKKSCQFIFKLFHGLNLDQHHFFLLKSLYFQDEVGRHLLACYETMKVILNHAFQTQKHIKIMVTCIYNNVKKDINFFLKPSHEHYVLSETKKEYHGDGLMIFAGISHCSKHEFESCKKYISRFINIGFENVILSNMAQHPQYSGVLLDDKKFNPYLRLDFNGLQQSCIDYIKESEKQFLQHKYLSSKIGCTPENSNLFLLTHVRCDNVVTSKETVSKELPWYQKWWNSYYNSNKQWRFVV